MIVEVHTATSRDGAIRESVVVQQSSTLFIKGREVEVVGGRIARVKPVRKCYYT